MITPRFSCAQTEGDVTISLYCPSVRASELDVSIDHSLVTIHISPYFLRLNLPGPVVNPEERSDPAEVPLGNAHYDASSGWLTVTLKKEQKGQHFADLDLLPKLLAPRQETKAPVIEVLHSQDSSNPESQEDHDAGLAEDMNRLNLDEERLEILKAAENDWRLPQSVEQPLHTSLRKPYGFLDMHSSYFLHTSHSENEVILSELTDGQAATEIEALDWQERRRRRLSREEKKWDPEYYMADYGDDEYIQELLHWNHPLSLSDASDIEFTEAENMIMLNLPRKEYLATPPQTHALYLTLLTILFAYAYDARTTQQDPTPESAWTIASLVPAFAALDPAPYEVPREAEPAVDEEEEVADLLVLPGRERYSKTSSIQLPSSAQPHIASPSFMFPVEVLEATVITSYRRVLAFPLYRSWALAEACKSDVASFLSKGKRAVIRCLLELKHILDHHDVYYVFSKIWIDDFLVWIALQPDETVRDLGKSLAAVRVQKKKIGWDLEALEAAVHEQMDRESDSDDESA